MSIPYDYLYPNPLVKPHGLEVAQNSLGGAQSPRSLATHPYNIWYGLLENYTGRQMTYDSDRLSGIAGLADLFARSTGDHLVCGLWSLNLVFGLMWERRRRLLGEKSHYRASQRTASWSWLNIIGPQRWAHNYSQDDVVVEDLSLDQETLTITLRGRLVQLQPLTWPINSRRKWPWVDAHRDLLNDPSGDLVENRLEGGVQDAQPSQQGGLYLLRVVRAVPGQRKGWGMLVTATSQADHYGRIGFAHLSSKDQDYAVSCEAFWEEHEVRTVCLV